MRLSELQVRAWENKVAHGFGTTDVPREVALLHAEVSEVFEAHRRGHGPDAVAAEVADVAIYLAGLAAMLGIDLEAAVAAKLDRNSRRRYAPGPGPDLARVPDGDADAAPAGGAR